MQGKQERFETLCDHVSDPNNERGLPLRPTFICSNKKCPLEDGEIIFWDEMGDVYIENYVFYEELNKNLKYVASQNILEAQNSFARKLTRQNTLDNIRTKLLTLKKWKWELRAHHACNEKGICVKRKFYIQTYKKNDPGWIYYSGFWRMLVFCIKQFNRNLKQYKENPSEWSRKELLEAFEPLKEWQKEDNYRKVFHWYVTTFYKLGEIK